MKGIKVFEAFSGIGTIYTNVSKRMKEVMNVERF